MERFIKGEHIKSNNSYTLYLALFWTFFFSFKKSVKAISHGTRFFDFKKIVQIKMCIALIRASWRARKNMKIKKKTWSKCRFTTMISVLYVLKTFFLSQDYTREIMFLIVEIFDFCVFTLGGSHENTEKN